MEHHEFIELNLDAIQRETNGMKVAWLVCVPQRCLIVKPARQSGESGNFARPRAEVTSDLRETSYAGGAALEQLFSQH
jgi:hypothetical protein